MSDIAGNTARLPRLDTLTIAISTSHNNLNCLLPLSTRYGFAACSEVVIIALSSSLSLSLSLAPPQRQMNRSRKLLEHLNFAKFKGHVFHTAGIPIPGSQ